MRALAVSWTKIDTSLKAQVVDVSQVDASLRPATAAPGLTIPANRESKDVAAPVSHETLDNEQAASLSRGTPELQLGRCFAAPFFPRHCSSVGAAHRALRYLLEVLLAHIRSRFPSYVRRLSRILPIFSHVTKQGRLSLDRSAQPWCSVPRYTFHDVYLSKAARQVTVLYHSRMAVLCRRLVAATFCKSLLPLLDFRVTEHLYYKRPISIPRGIQPHASLRLLEGFTP